MYRELGNLTISPRNIAVYEQIQNEKKARLLQNRVTASLQKTGIVTGK